MIRRVTAPLALLGLSLAAGACGSSPATTWVTLAPVPPERAAAAAAAAGEHLAVGRITLPPELDRASPARYQGRNRLVVAPAARWPAPLDALVRRTLTLDLAARLPDGEVVLPGQPDPEGSLQVVVVAFRAFAADSAGDVTLDARWTLVREPSEAPLLTREARVSAHAATPAWDDLAAAISEALARLSDGMAATLGGSGAPNGH